VQTNQTVASDKTRSQLVQIFRYIQALDQLRNPPQQEIKDQHWVLWFHDLPAHPAIVRGIITDSSDEGGMDETGSDDYILKIRKPTLSDMPMPPAELLPWLENGWQDIEGRIEVKPVLQNKRDGQFTEMHFEDNPQRKVILEKWVALRDRWVASEMPAHRAFALYEKLHSLLAEIERESERVELMAGDGLITWQSKNGSLVHHPILLKVVQLQFNPDIPEFTIVETDQPSELYTAFFQDFPEVSANALARCREDYAQGEWHPLGGKDTNDFLRRFVSELSPHGKMIENSTPSTSKTQLSVNRDPVLFLRPRNLGIRVAVETILRTLPQSTNLSDALISLIKVDDKTNSSPDNIPLSSSFEAPNGEDEFVLLSKPANAEQLEIARRLERDSAVLVQGPPGTGKTHTIANLIGHLLAQGKSVLVTSEKPKALRVLKEKVVEPLQPLCASILDDDNKSEMMKTIDAISERLSSSDANKLEGEANKLLRQRSNILQELRETRKKLIEARSSEYRAITIAGNTYSPAEAARHVSQNKDVNYWIPGPINIGMTLPLTTSELIDLYNSNVSLSQQEEREISILSPDSGQLPTPFEFEQLLAEQAELRQKDLNYRRDLWMGEQIKYSDQEMKQLQQRLVQEIEPLRNLSGWRLAALSAGREGGAYQQIWIDLAQETERVHKLAAEAQIFVLKYDPEVSQGCLPGRIEIVLREIIEFLQHGGKLNSLKLLMNKEWKTLIENTTVQGRRPAFLEDFQAIWYFVALNIARLMLVGRWQRQMNAFGEIDITNIGLAPESIFYQYVEPIRNYLKWYPITWEPLENELKKQGFQWERFLAEAPVSHVQHSEVLRLQMTVTQMLPPVFMAEVYRRTYNRIENKIFLIERNLDKVVVNSTKIDIVVRLRDAVKKRDVQLYRTCYVSLKNLHEKVEIARLRRMLLAKLEKAAPAWANAIRERVGIHSDRNLPGKPEDAWLWRQLTDELDLRSKMSLEELQDRINRLNRELYQITAELVEKNAWAAQVRRTTIEQRRALQGWREYMRKIGKGKGKRAPRLLAEARKLMPACQSAVPVWIMPLSLVARNFDMSRNRFDVVIIDEASQADITALVAVYMGKQVLVVGDDEQVSPLGIGQNLDELQKLIDEHLRGIPLANVYDSKLSIYSLARTSFTPVCLLEHFRCVSPIIQFSNDLSYNGKIKPLRDDSDVKIRPATIAYAVKSATKQGKVNETEAYAVASLLIAASEQPEYQDATFGIISMVGADQALYIETLLRRYMAPAEYVRRRVLCGDPAQFQGDERDVMFLSMVDIPGEGGPLTLRGEEGYDQMFKKRFNVAASRARDQIWVVHSLDPEIDLKQGDLRRRLILHARDQHARNTEIKAQEQYIESVFEKQVFDRLVRAGYRVKTQWRVGAYRIDMVVEGAGKRLAIECDGDRWHPQEKLEEDMARQAILERLGWRFVRIRGSQFFREPDNAMKPVFARLQDLDIPPEGMVSQNSENIDGKELKARIIRRADELSRQWKEATGSRIPAIDVKQSAYQVKSTYKAPDPTPKPRYVLPAANKNDSFNIVLFFQTKRIKVIDNREQNGGIWVVGGNELASIMQTLAAKGIQFRFVPGGIPYNSAAGRYYRDGWFAKSL
jgi:superfamily I DNA and/or RNA helicase/very-short-patch-repair endonuclease